MKASGLARTMATSIWSKVTPAGKRPVNSRLAESPGRTRMAPSLAGAGGARDTGPVGWLETTGGIKLAVTGAPAGPTFGFRSGMALGAPTGETSSV